MSECCSGIWIWTGAGVGTSGGIGAGWWDMPQPREVAWCRGTTVSAMPSLLLPHRASYALRGDGTEQLEVGRDASGWRIESHLDTTEARSGLEWHLLPDLSTRVLR